jgi:hypothetical protein
MSMVKASRRTVRLVAIAAGCVGAAALPAVAEAFNPQPGPPGIVSRIIVDPSADEAPNRPGVVHVRTARIPPDPYR